MYENALAWIWRPARVGLPVLIFLLVSSCGVHPSNSQPVEKPAAILSFSDADIQHAAEAALGENEGTIIAIDPADGRLRAVINPRLAFEQKFPPGSTIKVFTTLAAMRAGILQPETRIACRRVYRKGSYEAVCTHRRINNELALRHALGYSCNYYFSTIGDRISSGSFFDELRRFGFGEKTGINAHELTGTLNSDDWGPATAIGNDDHILTTPIQLLSAFSAIVNGGDLYTPRIAKADSFEASLIRHVEIPAATRKAIIEGMDGCVSFGSASESGLNKLPLDVIGKTGTSGSSNGFRTQGWFAGFLLKHKNLKEVRPDEVQLGFIVFIKKSHGSASAGVARDFISKLLGVEPRLESHINRYRVHLVRQNATIEVDENTYIRGILAAEAGEETEAEALKAQAIVSRTYARHNRGRHEKEGYDFCSLTHCQRYLDDPAAQGKTQIAGAAASTSGRVLVDNRDIPADVYFHASCGGITTDIESVWGQPSPGYITVHEDDYCRTMPHKEWISKIPAASLSRALSTEERSSVGKLRQIFIQRRDKSGRAQWLTLEGQKRKTVRGWDFALIVNRVLGWNQLKSSHFEVRLSGDTFEFRGRGFGHGLGLCQEGTHVMARRGRRAEDILNTYFPGARIKLAEAGVVRAPLSSPLVLSLIPTYLPSIIARLFESREHSSEHFKLTDSGKADEPEVAGILNRLEAARTALLEKVPAPYTRGFASRRIEIVLHPSTSSFMKATGQPWWAAAATNGNRIQLQPVALLRKRGVLDEVLRHELVHVLLEVEAKGKTPRWLGEALAIDFAGEARHYTTVRACPSQNQLERDPFKPSTPADMKQLYACAVQILKSVRLNKGDSEVWRIATKP